MVPAIMSRRVAGKTIDVVKVAATIETSGGLVDVIVHDPHHRDVETKVTIRVDDLRAAIGDQP